MQSLDIEGLMKKTRLWPKKSKANSNPIKANLTQSRPKRRQFKHNVVKTTETPVDRPEIAGVLRRFGR